VPGPLASSRFAKYAIVGILALGATLRLWGISGGLPYSVNVDEPQVMDRAFTMMKSGSPDPKGFYDYPTLTMYMSAAVASARFLSGAQNHEWRSLDDPRVWQGQFLHWCRIAIALLSVLTIYVVYRAGLRWGTAAAIVAALMMAVHPQLTQWAHYVLTDSPMTFFVAVTMLLSLCAAETGRWSWFLLAGAAAGLAAGTKYNGAVALVMPLVATLALPAGSAVRERLTAIGAVVGGAAAGFLLAAPYTVLNLPAFLNGFGHLLSVYPPQAEGKYWPYFRYILIAFAPESVRAPYPLFAAAAPALLLLFAGFAVLVAHLRARATRVRSFVVLLFAAVYFWFVSNQGGPSMTFERYQLAIWPALAIWFGVGAIAIRDLAAGPGSSILRRRIVTGVLLSVLVVPAFHALGIDQAMHRLHTVQQAGDWIVRNVKPNERVMIGTDWMQLPPRFEHDNANGLTRESIDSYKSRGVVYFVADSDHYAGNPADPADDLKGYRRIFDATSVVATFSRPGETTYTILKMK
jgi:4-amino-4-deoxy-L-arabinose transferase-like glycosyltransferase